MTNITTVNQIYRRRISPLEGMFLHAPYAIVTMTARIKGAVTEKIIGRSSQESPGQAYQSAA